MSDTIYHIAQPDGSTRQATVMEITQEIKAGTITQETPLWCSSWTDWRNCGTLPEFQHLFKPAAVPPPSPYHATPPPPPRNTRHKTKPWMWIVVGAVMIPLGLIVLLSTLSKCGEYVADGYMDSQRDAMFKAIEKDDAKELSRIVNDPIVSRVLKCEEGEAGEIMLCLACSKGKPSCVNVFLKAGVDANACYEGKPIIIFACMQGHTACVEALLNAGANANARSKYGYSALMAACECGQEACVRALIKAGASVHARADNGMTALDIAVQKGELECAKLLRAAGATD